MQTFTCNLHLGPVLMEKCTCLQDSSYMNSLNEVKWFMHFFPEYQRLLDFARAL